MGRARGARPANARVAALKPFARSDDNKTNLFVVCVCVNIIAGKPVSWIMIAPSITPIKTTVGSNNPAMRLYKFDTDTGQVSGTPPSTSISFAQQFYYY